MKNNVFAPHGSFMLFVCKSFFFFYTGIQVNQEIVFTITALTSLL